MSTTKVFIIGGHLGQDAEVTTFENGSSVISFSAATNESWTDKATGEKREEIEWHECKRFVKEVNDKFVALLTKGTKVTVIGKLKYNTWERTIGNEKVTQTKAYIKVEEIDITPKQ